MDQPRLIPPAASCATLSSSPRLSWILVLAGCTGDIWSVKGIGECIAPSEDTGVWLVPAPDVSYARSSREVERGNIACEDGAYNVMTDVLTDCFPPAYCKPEFGNCGHYQCWYCIPEAELEAWSDRYLRRPDLDCANEPNLGGARTCSLRCR